MKARLTQIARGRLTRAEPEYRIPRRPVTQPQFWIYRSVTPAPEESQYDNWYEFQLVTETAWSRIQHSSVRNQRGQWQRYWGDAKENPVL